MSFALPCLQLIVFICSFPRYIFSCPSLFLQLVPWRSSDRHVSKATRQTHWCFPFTFGCHRYCIAYITYSKISSKYLERYTYLHAHILSWYEPRAFCMPSSSPLIWNPLVSLRARGKTTNRRNCWSSYGRLPGSHWGHVKLMRKIPQMGTPIRLRSRRLRIFHVRNLVIGAIVFWWFWCSLSGFDRILWNL